MPLPKEELLKRINQAVLPGFSSNLVSRGLARSLLWNDGVLPPGAPEYSPALSSELQSYGVRLLHLCLELRDHEKDKVVSLAAASDWPTPETASLWRKFIAGFNTADNSKWSAIQFRSTVDWLKPPSPGLRVMVRGGRYIESADREPLGILKEPLSFSDSGIFDARISPDCSGIEGKWIGPTVH